MATTKKTTKTVSKNKKSIKEPKTKKGGWEEKYNQLLDDYIDDIFVDEVNAYQKEMDFYLNSIHWQSTKRILIKQAEMILEAWIENHPGEKMTKSIKKDMVGYAVPWFFYRVDHPKKGDAPISEIMRKESFNYFDNNDHLFIFTIMRCFDNCINEIKIPKK